jgi:hypothetical protein
MATAFVVPPVGDCYPVNLPEQSAHVVLNEHVGGHFDVVRLRDVVGYVHDEGLLIGLPLNPRASMLFNMTLVGNCVLVGCLDSAGDYDGDDYDVPQHYVDMVSRWQVIPIQNKETETK